MRHVFTSFFVYKTYVKSARYGKCLFLKLAYMVTFPINYIIQCEKKLQMYLVC